MIESLRQEHSKIIDTLNKIKKLGIGSKEGRGTLLLAKEFILKHMEREDKEFYPIIKEAAKHNPMLKRVLKEFDEDMEQITFYTIGFFDGYSTSNNKDMNIAIEKFIEILKRRMLREDNILFPEFKKLQEKNA